MLKEPEASKLFTPVDSESSDVSFYILDEKIAPVQQGFYFVNNSMSNDGRYLWFHCAFPPSVGRTLGVVDFEKDELRHFPETQFQGASPYVDPETGWVYWGSGLSVWRRGPQQNDTVELVNSVPEELVGHRRISRCATHLTRSADGKEFFIDMGAGLKVIFGSLPLDGSDFELWHSFERNYNHAQFSPADPDLALFAEENHSDQLTGLRFPIKNRMWLIRRGGAPEPVFEEPTKVTHEWWDADGEHVWCVSGDETWRVDINTGETEKISFPHHCWHSHNSYNGKWLTCDSNNRFYRGCASGVHILNRETDTEKTIVMNPAMENFTGRNYHIDPHPRFCCKDRYVIFTTTVRGKVDLAMLPIEKLSSD